MKAIRKIFLILFVMAAAVAMAVTFGCRTEETVISFTLSYQTDGNGYVKGSAEQTVPYGESGTEVRAEANEGYKFVGWSDGVQKAYRKDKNVTADKTVVALFEKQSCTLRYSADGNGYIEGSAEQTVLYGESGTPVTAVPYDGGKFIGWSDGVQTASRTDADIVHNLNIIAKFVNVYTLKYQADSNGHIEGEAFQVVAEDEVPAAVKAVPDVGYKFIGWSDGYGSDERSDINRNVNATALFEFAFAGGNGTPQDPFTIENHTQLMSMRYHPDQCYKLLNDLDLTGILHEPVFDAKTYFCGTLYGNNKTVKNMRVESQKNFPSLLGVMIDAAVCDLNISGFSITCDKYTQITSDNYGVAGLAGRASGSIENVTVSGTITSDVFADGAYTETGGIVGRADNCSFYGCNSDVRISVNNSKLNGYFGGMVGYATSVNIKNCNSCGEINIFNAINTGGLVGYYSSGQADVIITGCSADVEITDESSDCSAGGLIDRLYVTEGSALRISDCSVSGNITAGRVGGFIQYAASDGTVTIENCGVENSISSYHNAAGFIRSFSGARTVEDSLIKECSAGCVINIFEIDDPAIKAGMACGFTYTMSRCTLIDCYARGELTGKNTCGIGYYLSECDINGIYFDGTICCAQSRVSSLFIFRLSDLHIKNGYVKGEMYCDSVSDYDKNIFCYIDYSSIENFYYAGNSCTKVYQLIEESQITNFHMRCDQQTVEGEDRGENPSVIDITVYGAIEEMYGLADILNMGLDKPEWADVPDSTPILIHTKS